MRLDKSSTDCHYLSGMQSARRTSCQPAAPSSCAPPPGAGCESAPELPRAAAWPSPPSGPELSSGSVQTPAAGTCRSRHSGRLARLGAGSLCAVENMTRGQREKITDQSLQLREKKTHTASIPVFFMSQDLNNNCVTLTNFYKQTHHLSWHHKKPNRYQYVVGCVFPQKVHQHFNRGGKK